MRSAANRLVVLGGLVMALCAVTAASAAAATFNATAKGNVTGHQLSAMETKSGIGTIHCTTDNVTGAVTQLVSQDLKLTVQYGGCTLLGLIDAVPGPAEYELHADRTVDLLNSVTWHLPGCEFVVRAQPGIKTSAYTNSSGSLHTTAAFAGMHQRGSGGLCGGESSTVTMRDLYSVELEGGSLTFTP